MLQEVYDFWFLLPIFQIRNRRGTYRDLLEVFFLQIAIKPEW